MTDPIKQGPLVANLRALLNAATIPHLEPDRKPYGP
jgi:hypothetical protein